MAAYGSDTAIHADPNEGPMFGAGYDLKIVDQPGDSSKDNTETASNTMGLGMSYKCPCTAGDAMRAAFASNTLTETTGSWSQTTRCLL